MTAQKMWEAFVTEKGIVGAEYEAWAFGASAEDADELSELVCLGAKTGTASAYPLYEIDGEELPKAGEYSVILNSKEEAVCVIQTTKVYIVPYCEVSVEHAYKEGEGDRSLAYWRRVHEKFFTECMEEAGLNFDEHMKVVCEEFEVVYKMQQEYTEINSKTFDKWSEDGWEWAQPISHEIYEKAVNGDWKVVLTPTKPVPKEWFCEMKDAKVLGLASGGGQQMPIFAALGAECTVLDYSEAQLASEKMVAEREGYDIRIVKADMTKPLPFADESFDLIFHPVSNCYVEEVLPIWRECYRVLKKGGILLAGLDNGMNYVFDVETESVVTYKLPFNALRDKEMYELSVKNDWGIQFSHSIEEQIGGQLKAGFVLEDIYEDTNGSGNLHEHNVPTFWATKAVKK